MLEIARWYNNFQSPSILMIDDLSDAYIDKYEESYKNDWGYLGKHKNSSYDFLKKNLLDRFPKIKISFFVPYLKHSVINDNSTFKIKKYAVGEREEFTKFLQFLQKNGHEIAHHGSNHGKYINPLDLTIGNNWKHEWLLFNSVAEGVDVVLKGVRIFSKLGIEVTGGKYCGYASRNNSNEIIDSCNFMYWCDKPSYMIKEYNESIFGENDIVSFPTNFGGHSFVRLKYLNGDKRKDRIKKISKYFQPLYNLYAYIRLFMLYKNQQIISIQEHYSPSTTNGIDQSANIITDIESLQKTFSLLDKLSIWYATCNEIAEYIYVREHVDIKIDKDYLTIKFNNIKNIKSPKITLKNKNNFTLVDKDNNIYNAEYNNKAYIINILLLDLENVYKIQIH